AGDGVAAPARALGADADVAGGRGERTGMDGGEQVNIVVANTVGRLADGRHVMAYPAHWDWVSQLPPNAYKPNTFYPYELGYMSSVLKREFPDAHVRMVDGNLRQLDADEYAALLKPLRPDVLVTETSFVTYGEMTKVMRVLAAYNADLVEY